MELVIGFALVLLLGLAFYFGGAMIVSRMSKARHAEEREHRFEEKEPAKQELKQQFAENRALEHTEQKGAAEQPPSPL